MGSNGASGGGGNTGREKGITNQYSGPKGTTGKSKSGFEKALDVVKKVSPTYNLITGIKKGINKTKSQNSLDYEGQAYGTKSSSSYSMGGGDGGNTSNVGAATSSGVVVQSPKVNAPTTVEVSQSESVNAADSPLLRNRKIKYRGRSVTINTSPTGAVGSLTLGKPSLLGR